MNFVQHSSNTGALGAPIGWDQKRLPCDALPITLTRMGDAHAIVSYWKPSPEDLRRLAEGGLVQLWVIGHTHPPVAMAVVGPDVDPAAGA